MDAYDAKAIEERGSAVWADAHAFEVANPAPSDGERLPKSYVLEMLPYPSGELHMGHMLVYTIGDVVTHFRRRNGMHVLHPQGFDAFGLPAENAAIREGGHPREIIERNIENITRSMRRDRLGDRLDARGLDARARVLPLAAVAVPARSSSAASRTARPRP